MESQSLLSIFSSFSIYQLVTGQLILGVFLHLGLCESAVESDLEPNQNSNKIDHQLMYIDKIVVI